MPIEFDIIQKATHDGWRKIFDCHLVDCMATELACEWQQQSQCIAITGLSVEREVALRHHMLEQEAPDPEAKQIAVIHDCPPPCAYCAKRRPASSSNSIGRASCRESVWQYV